MIRVHVRNARVNRSFVHSNGPIEFGRVPSMGSTPRFVLFDEAASKCHLRATEVAGGMVKLENTSTRSPVSLHDRPAIAIGGTQLVALPVQISLGHSEIEIAWMGETPTQEVNSRTPTYETIAAPLSLTGSTRSSGSSSQNLISLRSDISPERLIRWLESIIHVQRAAAGSSEFYQETVEALVETVGMDVALLLLRDRDGWSVSGHYRARPDSRQGSDPPRYSQSLVQSVLEQKRTLFRNSSTDDMSKSLAEIEAVVASPILDRDDKVIGVLYASRDVGSGSESRAVGSLDAQVVQLLASTVATGLARAQHEADAVRNRVQFEQFFSRPLAAELERNPALLNGTEREVTLLFADIRGFSRLAQKLAPGDYYRMAQDVLSRLTEQVHEREGVVVDYTGDGLLAMWNAPFEQSDHARRACEAALGMLRHLPELKQKWNERTGGILDLGIGLNTGLALVGNTGTPQKLKYGPRGHHVNLGSRIEGATKHLGVRIIASAETIRAAGPDVRRRRIGRAKLVGLTEPVDLFEIYGVAPLPVDSRRERYEQAYASFESGEWENATQILRSILSDLQGDLDLPTFQLLARVLQATKNPPSAWDATWVLDTK